MTTGIYSSLGQHTEVKSERKSSDYTGIYYTTIFCKCKMTTQPASHAEKTLHVTESLATASLP